jgi:thymidine phosphorylase
VGFTGLARAGDAVGPDRPLATIHARDAASADRAEAALRAAYLITAEPQPADALLRDRIA